jgi:hypothetical protein
MFGIESDAIIAFTGYASCWSCCRLLMQFMKQREKDRRKEGRRGCSSIETGGRETGGRKSSYWLATIDDDWQPDSGSLLTASVQDSLNRNASWLNHGDVLNERGLGFCLQKASLRFTSRLQMLTSLHVRFIYCTQHCVVLLLCLEQSLQLLSHKNCKVNSSFGLISVRNVFHYKLVSLQFCYFVKG